METDLEFFERLMKEQELKKDNPIQNNSVDNITHIVNPLQIKIHKIVIEKRDNKKKKKMNMIFE